MFKNPEIFRKLAGIVQNHLARAREGRRLLEEGRSLREMQTPPIGLTSDETLERRQAYLDWVASLDPEKLKFVYGNVVHNLKNRWEQPDKGTSELEWERIVFEDEFEHRGLQIPRK